MSKAPSTAKVPHVVPPSVSLSLVYRCLLFAGKNLIDLLLGTRAAMISCPAKKDNSQNPCYRCTHKTSSSFRYLAVGVF